MVSMVGGLSTAVSVIVRVNMLGVGQLAGGGSDGDVGGYWVNLAARIEDQGGCAVEVVSECGIKKLWGVV